MSVTAAPDRVEVDGRVIPLPCEVRDASVANVVLTADVGGLRALLPHDGLEPVEVRPGRGLLMLSAAHYRDNDLGAYDEVSIAAVVRPAAPDDDGASSSPGWLSALGSFRGDVGVCILRLPVDDAFSCAAGRQVWGFPKTVEDLSVRDTGRAIVAVWRSEGRDVLRFAVRAGGRMVLPAADQITYTVLDGELQRVQYRLVPAEARVGPGGARLHLGHGPVADELRALSLSSPLFSASVGRLRGRFEAPQPVSARR